MPETQKITSRSNDRLVQIRKVRDGKVPDRVFIEGARLAEEALRSEIELVEAVFSPEFLATPRGRQLVERFRETGIRLIEVSKDLFKTIADTAQSQGVALIARRPESGPDRFADSLGSADLPLFLYFHETNDPSNLGAVFRTAEAAGVSGIILSPGSADPFSPKALRAGMGANLRIPIWDRAEMFGLVDWARGRRIRIIASDVKGSRSYAGVDWQVPTLLMFGSEAHGLDESVLELVDEIVTIPMKNGVESLNLAVSAGIILFEAVRQNS